MSEQVHIQATYVGDQPLLSILEANIDLEQVSFSRTQMAVKALFPVDLVVTALTLHAFEKLVLDPLLAPIAEKFNWVSAVKRLIKPHQPFNVLVRIGDADFIEAPLDLDHFLLAEVWRILKGTLEILRNESLLDSISLIRITSNSPGRPLVIAYRGARPSLHVLVSEGRTQPISNPNQDTKSRPS